MTNHSSVIFSSEESHIVHFFSAFCHKDLRGLRRLKRQEAEIQQLTESVEAQKKVCILNSFFAFWLAGCTYLVEYARKIIRQDSRIVTGDGNSIS